MPVKPVCNRIVFIGIFLCLNLILIRCGQRGSPTGGVKDITPPSVIYSSPENGGANFQGKEITLKFDEYVQVKSFNQEFMISPPIKGQVNYKLVGKRLILKFDSAFSQNTTYQIFLGNSVVDLNEGNPLDSNNFVFSTGNQLDSLEYKGIIVDAYSGGLEDDVMVFLYRNLHDSAPKTEVPSYFTRAKDGQYHFKNLSGGQYRLFALKDDNNNYQYDLPTEKIAFLEEPITIDESNYIPALEEIDSGAVDSSVTKISFPEEKHETEHISDDHHDHVQDHEILATFVADKRKQKILKPYFQDKNELIFPFNASVGRIKILALDGSNFMESSLQKWNKNRDSLQLFKKEFTDSSRISLIVQVDTLAADTFRIKTSTKKRSFQLWPNYKNGIANNYNHALVYKSAVPLKKMKDTLGFILSENDTSFLTSSNWKLDSTAYSYNYKINFDFKPGNEYKVKIYPEAITDALGLTNKDSLHYSFPMAKEGSFGNLVIKYALDLEGPFVFQLTKGDKVRKEVKRSANSGSLSFNGIDPGTYLIRVVVDSNGDGKWSPGDYDTKKQAEKVLIRTKPIAVRANWDMVTEWKN